MGKYKSMIAERMMPSYIPDRFIHRDAYPSERFVSLVYCPAIDSAYYDIVNVGNGYFHPTKNGDYIFTGNPWYTLWLPDKDGICNITKTPAPFNKLMGYIEFDYINWDDYDGGCFKLVGLHRPFEVSAEWIHKL